MNKRIKHMTFVALLLSFAIVLHMFEASLALPLPYGMKLGLANIISLITIKKLGIKEVLFVNFCRVLIGGLLSGTFLNYMWWISLGGVTLSTIGIIIFKKLPTVSMSIVSSILHGIGQICIVSYIYNTLAFIPVFIFMFVSGILTGIFTGLSANTVLKYLK